MFVPECVAPKNGDTSPAKSVYKEMQCFRGMCWCMQPEGTIVDGTLTKGPVKCSSEGTLRKSKMTMFLAVRHFCSANLGLFVVLLQGRCCGLSILRQVRSDCKHKHVEHFRLCHCKIP